MVSSASWFLGERRFTAKVQRPLRGAKEERVSEVGGRIFNEIGRDGALTLVGISVSSVSWFPRLKRFSRKKAQRTQKAEEGF